MVIEGGSKALGESSMGNEYQREIDDMKRLVGDTSQFDSALKVQSYGGKCPDMSGSGGRSRSTGIIKIRNSHLSNAVYESAVSLVLHRNKEFYDLFNRELTKKKSRTEAYVVVGKRLLFHVYSMMKNEKPYRERKPGNVKGSGDHLKWRDKIFIQDSHDLR